MITHFHIENFKSLVNFDLPSGGGSLGGFTCLIGLNGSGKSTLLQAFDFAAQLARGGMLEWNEQRNWKYGDYISNFGRKQWIIPLRIEFSFQPGETVIWDARFNLSHAKCTQESIKCNGSLLMDLADGRLSLASENGELKKQEEKLDLVYQGSVLSVLQLGSADHRIQMVKRTLLGIKSLELLAPHLMRRQARKASDVGIGGEKLSAFLDSLSPSNQAALLERLQHFYPQITKWRIKTLRAGWKNLLFRESYPTSTGVEAAHINDGLLRVVAMLAQAYTTHSVLLFDEIENGINPELAEKLMDFFIELGEQGKQVLVTTHSPVLLNYIPDVIAQNGIVLLYRTRDGITKSTRFFDLPGMREKLRFLGPGEVFADTRLTDLSAALERQDVQPDAVTTS